MITYVLMFICIYEMFICIHDNICTRDELGYNMMHVCMYACMYVLYICTHFVYTHTPSLSPPLPLHPPPPRSLIYTGYCCIEAVAQNARISLSFSLCLSLSPSLSQHTSTQVTAVLKRLQGLQVARAHSLRGLSRGHWVWRNDVGGVSADVAAGASVAHHAHVAATTTPSSFIDEVFNSVF